MNRACAEYRAQTGALPRVRHGAKLLRCGLLPCALAACDAQPASDPAPQIRFLASAHAEVEDTLVRAIVRRQRGLQSLLADPERTGLAEYLDISFVWGPLTPSEGRRVGDTVQYRGSSALVGYFGILAGFVPPGLDDLTEFEVRIGSESSASVTAVNAARTSCIWTVWRRKIADPAGWRAARMMPIRCPAALRGPQVRSHD